MPASAYALLALFTVLSAVLAVLAVRLVARAGGPRSLRACLLPLLAAFGAFYVVGHKAGLAVGPEVSLFGFQVALFGDLAIGFAAALVVAVLQALVVRARARSSNGS